MTFASLLPLSCALLLPAAPEKATFPAPGSNVPGPFLCYNLNGKKKDRFHCLVTEHELDPVAAVFVRGAEVREYGLKDLLAKLDDRDALAKSDSAVKANSLARLACFAVFVTEALKDLSREDDQREKLVAALEKQADPGKLKHVVLGLATADAVAGWKLDKDADVVVVLYKNYRTAAVHNLKWAQLKMKPDDPPPAAVQAILNDIKTKLGAKR